MIEHGGNPRWVDSGERLQSGESVRLPKTMTEKKITKRNRRAQVARNGCCEALSSLLSLHTSLFGNLELTEAAL